MRVAKIAITMEATLLKRVDRLVRRAVYPNRSKAIQEAVAEKLARFEHTRLALECAKLDPKEERDLADIGLCLEESEWPAY